MTVEQHTTNATFDASSKDEVITDFITAGATLLVLRGKIPVAKEWTKFESEKPQTPQDFPGNYGVRLEEDDLVIDYDPRNDHTEGKKAFQNLVNYVGVAFDTFTVKTGGGGLHVYLKKPKNILVLNELCTDPTKAKAGEKCYPEFSGLEFKSVGRQVVGPQSVHPTTGEKYLIEWKKPSDERMQAPQILLDLIERPADNFGIDLDAESMGAFTDDDQSVGRYVNFINDSPPAVEGCGGDLHTYKIACRGRDFNLSPQKTFEIMLSYFNPKCLPSWEEKELWVKVKSAYVNNKDVQGKWSPELSFDLEDVPEGLKKAPLFWRDKDGKPKKMLCNVISFMQMEENPLYDLLQYNLFTKNIEFKERAPWHTVDGQSWSDDDAVHYKAWLSEVKEFEINAYIIHEAALAVSVKSAYHPIQGYLESLEWDGKKRLGTWISDYCDTEENIYTRAIGEKVLVAAVTRIFNPGTKFDHVLIIEGPQGVGKSTLVSILGKYWYGDIIIDPHNKDTVDALRSKWIVEISEMECAKREISALKRFITCTSDRVRPAYARSSQDFPRQCIFVGTINPENGRGYLKDPTGNRRYWPVNVSAVDFIRLRKDMDQLWAEAVQVFKKGKCKLYLETKELQDFANQQTEERFEADPIEEVIGNYMEDTQLERITTAQIMQDCLIMPLSKLDKFYAMRISSAMGRLGFVNSVRKDEDGRSVRCYVKAKKRKNELEYNDKETNQESQKQNGFDSKSLNSNSNKETNLDI